MNVLPSVHLQLHGYPAVAIDGCVRPLKLKHALALLARLAEQREPVGREALAALLWPDAAADLGRTRLRRLVHETHERLGTAVIETQPDTLRLAAHVSSDLQATRAAMQAAQARTDPDSVALAALLHRHAAQLLAGFGLGSEVFDDWLAAQRRAHEAACTRALERVAARALAIADLALAEAAAQALLRIDPCNEAAHAARLEARALQRDAAGVETAYHECARALREELGVRPSQRLEAAYVKAVGQARSDPMRLSIAFAATRHGQVAHAAWGCGEETIVVLWGLMSNLEVALEEPRARALLDTLAQDHRIVMLDRRGTGLSERVGVTPGADATAEDISAVLDHLGIRRAWLFGSSVGGTLALDYALRQPQRTAGLLLWGTSPSGRWTPQTPWALTPAALEAWVARLSDPQHYHDSLQRFAPSAANDPWVRDWYARLLRNAGTRVGTAQMLRAYQAMDLRAQLQQLRVPTLVMQRRGDRVVPLAAGEQLAQAIPRAHFAALDGNDHFLWHGDSSAVIAEVHNFVAASSSLRAAA